MKLTRLLVFLFIAIAVINFSAHAQSINSENLKQVNVDNLSDGEIKAYYQRAKSTGLSDEELYRLASQRGMPESQIAKLRVRIASLNQGSSAAPSKNGTDKDAKKDSSGTKHDLTSRQVNEDAMNVPMKAVKRDTTIFGSELFMASSMVFEPNLRIPSPGNYTLGPDDEVDINVYGYSEQVYNLTVTAEGNIYIPNVGPIKVSGLTLEVAADRIRNKLAATIYKAIRTGQTKVDVTLGKIRSIRVTVIGQATKPGTYTVSSLTTLFNILYLCGGPNETGSYRNIELIRGNKTIQTVDLYAFLLNGDRKNNVLLKEQDVVRIPYYNTRVVMEGEVKRPGKFELEPGENFSQLLSFSGGFSDSAYRSTVHVTRITDTGIVLSDVVAKDFAAFGPRTGDAFYVSRALDRFSNRVSLDGAVMRPGDFELKPGMTLKQLIEIAGGLREDAFMERGVVLRQNDDLTLSSKAFVLKDIVSGKEVLPLKREDVITISSILDMRDAFTINIEGAVRNPGAYSLNDSLTLKDLILKAGGFSESANPTKVEISRRIKNPDIRQANFKQAEVVTVDISKGLSSAGGETMLRPYDLVSVRSEPGFNNPRVVYLEGQVMNPGRYVLESSSERISNLIKRSGGFKASADSSSITIRRLANTSLSVQERQAILERLLDISSDSLEASPELREKFLKQVQLLGVNVDKIKADPEGSENLILESGDYITVARASNLVRVNGEVYNPTLLPFEKRTSARYYIRRSGSFTNNAKKADVFVIYPDGRARSTKHFLWAKFYPSVTPRTEIYVPAKDRDKKHGFGTGEWIAVSSIFASLATLVIAVLNSN